MDQHEPEAFYTATDKDMVRPALHFVPNIVIRIPGGFNTPNITRTIVVGGRTVTMPVPLIDLLDGMVAAPVSYRPFAMAAVWAGQAGPTVPAEDNGLGFTFGVWQLVDMKLGVTIPVDFEVNDPHGPAVTAGLRRYLVEARPRGVHVAQAWAELVAGRHAAWLEREKARRDSVDAEVVRERPADPRAIGA